MKKLMIDGNKIGAYSWNSCGSIDDLIDYLNTLEFAPDQWLRLESLLGELYQNMRE